METATARSGPSLTISQTEIVPREDSTTQPVLRLRLQKPKNDKKVAWHEGTVDNEHLNKKKSKCCCIYKKPTAFGESSSEDDEECENCFGHPEKRRKNREFGSQDNNPLLEQNDGFDYRECSSSHCSAGN
uniref:E3 ubiquitin-protein ligase PPP1R11 n=1 Tax=Glossina brevipalpis TaxID=37001 RepID=A0A1A9WUC3_9MUSC